MLKRFLLAIVLMACSTSVYARNKVYVYAELGGQKVSVAGFQSTTTVMKTYPGATVNVYKTGTSTAATLYNISDCSTPLGNPATASTTDASLQFCVDDGVYDLTFTCTAPNCTTEAGKTWTVVGITVGTGGMSMSVTGFGAKCDGTTDDTAAFQAAENFSGAHTITIPRGTCKLTDTITIDQGRINWVGAGVHVTTLNFVPTSGGKPLFSYTNGASVNYESSIKSLTISSTDTTYQKIAIRLTDVSKFVLEEVAVGPSFHGAGALGAGTSIGLQIRGRELGVVKNCTFNSDQPISIEDNPNTNQVLDLDQWHFEDIYTLATGANPHWKFASGLQVTDFVLDGANIGTDNGLSLGTGYGDYLYWVDSAPAAIAASDGFSVFSSRLEGVLSNPGSAQLVNIQKTAGVPLRNVLFSAVHTGSTNKYKGWYFRNVIGATFINSYYYGTIEAFNCDSTCDAFVFMNTQFLNGTMTATGMRRIFGAGRRTDSAEPLRMIDIWMSNANDSFIISSVTFANLSIPDNGSLYYCSDCNKATPCTGGGSGAFAKRVNGTWDCD